MRSSSGTLSIRRQVATATLVVLLGNLISRLLGLVREQTTAWLFGATGATDAFVAAVAVPTMLYDFLVVGAVSAALVPVFVDAAEERERLWQIVSTVLNLAGLVLLCTALALALLAEPLILLLGAGFEPWQQSLAVSLLRIMLGALVLRGLAGVLTAVLYAQQRFIWPSLAPAVFNLGIILLAISLHQTLGIHALAAGVLLGAIAQLALQAAGLPALRYQPRFDFQSAEVRAILRLCAPVVAGILVSFLGIGLDRYLASHLEPGSMSVMSYATRLIQLPLGLVGTTCAIAVLPILAKNVRPSGGSGAVAGQQAFREALYFGLRLVILLTLPAMLGLAALITPLVRLLFEHGAFTSYDTVRTATVFLFYLPQLPFTALEQVLIYAFYARRDPKIPALVSVLALVCYLAVALPALGPLGVNGLALANTAQHIASAVVLLALLHRAAGPFELSNLLGFSARVLAAASLMALVTWSVLALLGPLLGASAVGLGMLLAAAIGLGMGVFSLAALLFGVAEIRQLWTMLSALAGYPRSKIAR